MALSGGFRRIIVARIVGAFLAGGLASCASSPGTSWQGSSAEGDAGGTQQGNPGTYSTDDAGDDAGEPRAEAGQDTGLPAVPDAGDASQTLPDSGDAAVMTMPDSGDDSGSMGNPDTGMIIGTWSQVSFGVTTLDTGGGGNNIVIAYGGYTATDQDSQGWVTQMTTVRLGALGVGHMYAVRGPEDPDYSSREIGNSELATALATQSTSATHIIIMAHSSGGFVADELFTFISSSVMGKVAYFNLDGGSWALTDAMVATMQGVYFCGAHDSVAGYSENWSSDESLNSTFAGSHLFLVDADGSGCDVGAGWCMHDTLIINHPHDPTTYDLDLDYTDFTNGRQVVTSYIDQAVTDGVL